jgi:flagellar hook-length control protein FliK
VPDAVAPAPATGAHTSGDAGSGDATGRDPGTGADPGTAAIAAAGGTSTQAAAPTGPAAPANQPAAPPPPVAGQLAQQVAVFRGAPDGTHSMTVVLRPDNLGPVQVQVTPDKGVVDLTLRGAHDQGRDALLQALPDLRRDLQSAGLTCSRLDVDRDTGGSGTQQQSAQQHSAQQQAAQQQAGGDPRGQGSRNEPPAPRAWVRSPVPADRSTAISASSTSTSAVDVLA